MAGFNYTMFIHDFSSRYITVDRLLFDFYIIDILLFSSSTLLSNHSSLSPLPSVSSSFFSFFVSFVTIRIALPQSMDLADVANKVEMNP